MNKKIVFGQWILGTELYFCHMREDEMIRFSHWPLKDYEFRASNFMDNRTFKVKLTLTL